MNKGRIITFWSPYAEINASRILAAVSCDIAMRYSCSQLLLNGEKNAAKLETSFFKGTQDFDYSAFNDSNICTIERIAASGLLEGQNIKDYTETIIPERIDMIRGSFEDDENKFREYEHIINCGRSAFDLICFNAQSGLENRMTEKMIINSDFLFICLNQNLQMLRDFKNDNHISKFLKDKKSGIILDDYMVDSKYDMKLIRHILKFDYEIYSVPLNMEMLDSINDHKIIRYFYSNYDVKKKDRNFVLMKELMRTSKMIANLCLIGNQQYSIKSGGVLKELFSFIDVKRGGA